VRRPTWGLLSGCHIGRYPAKKKSELFSDFFYGRVGAINLEQLDVLLESLKSYWDYTSQKSFLDEIKAPTTKVIRAENELTYEL